jgi:hypothetical protein
MAGGLCLEGHLPVPIQHAIGASASVGAPFLSNDLNINRLASTIAAGFDSKGDLLPDAEMAPVIRQRGVVNVYIGTKRTFGKTETFLDIPLHDDSSGSIHGRHLTYA